MPAHANATEKARERQEGLVGKKKASRRYGRFIVTALVLAALAAYIFSYYATVKRRHFFSWPPIARQVPWYSNSANTDRFLRYLYGPLHEIDFYLRYSYWNPTEGEVRAWKPKPWEYRD
jgi:hypothetical protein